MAKDCTLHYFPGSYYSLKAVLTLHEKGIPFKDSIVNIYNGEQHASWYLKLNPKGQVPVLQHGDRAIPDSETIIDYVDLHWDSGPRLVPDVETAIGQEMHALRQLLNEVPIGPITFGVLANRKLCSSEIRFPERMAKMVNRDYIVTRFQRNTESMKEAREKVSGQARAEFDAKIESSSKFLATITNEESVLALLDNLEKTFDKIEDQLEKSRKEAMGDETFWLVGKSLTGADITAAIFMYRLHLLGIDNRYFSDTKRVIVRNYFDRLLQRPAMKKTVAIAETAGRVFAKAFAWKMVKAGLVVGAVVLGLFAAREVYIGRRGLRRI